MKYDPQKAGCLCAACPLNGESPVPPEGPLDAEYVIISESPGFWEVKKNRPMVGPAGIQFDDILYYSEIKRDRCWLSSAILCRPEVPGLAGKAKYETKRYMAWIRSENAKRKKAAKLANERFEPIPSPFECCAPRLWAELGHFENVARQRGQPNGAVVLPLGNYALHTITGKSGILKLRGSPIPIDMNDPYATRDQLGRTAKT